MTTPDSILPLTGPELKNKGYALFCTNTAVDTARSDQCLVQRIESTLVTDGGTAATAVTEEAVVSFPFTNGAKILGCTVLAPVAVTLNASNFATFNLFSRTSAGASQVAIGTLATSATSLVAFAPTPMTLTTANVIVPAGGCLTVSVPKSGTGVAIASATAQCLIEIWLEEL